MLKSEEYRHFRMAVGFSLGLAIVVALFLLIYGKNDSFLIINKFNSPQFDYVFRYYTYLGDGIIWVPVFAYVLLFKRDFLVPVIAGLIISTILTHLLKRVIFPEELRPIGTLKDRMHMIPGLEIYRNNSFPSGHTGTAFTLALIMSYMVRKNIWVFFFPVIAFFVGYSRVYLAEHFVTDVFAGILVGIISAWLSLLIHDAMLKRKQKKAMEQSENKQ